MSSYTSFLRRLATPPQVLVKRDTILAAAGRHKVEFGRVLNVGSKNVRIGRECINFDLVAGPDVDVVGDAHFLDKHFDKDSFDTVVLSAVLQYCEHPRLVLQQVDYVLRPNGWLLIDVPFIQPYCYDAPDLWRFTADGLRSLCAPHVTIIELSSSIATGPALAYAAQCAARNRDNRYSATLMAWAVSLAVYPLRFLQNGDPRTAGALLLIGRKPPAAWRQDDFAAAGASERQAILS